MRLSAFFFGDSGQIDAADQCRLVLEVARRADQLGLEAIWLPERHFHPFGGPFPNPSVMAAAVATTTTSLRIRAGSVVLPLHHPVRVAEEWAVVDALSGGRVDLAFATGWNPDDFALAPEAFLERRERTQQGIELVQRLWGGESVALSNGAGDHVEIRTYPRPVQPQFRAWLTCTANPEGFDAAGRGGFNVLTALLHQSQDDLTDNIARYRKAREQGGHEGAGTITLMVHTYVAPSDDELMATVRAPLTRYLSSSADLWSVALPSLGQLSGYKEKLVMDLAIERYVRRAGLFGSPATCAATLDRLAELGVDEVACLVDFGLESHQVLDGVDRLGSLVHPVPTAPR